MSFDGVGSFSSGLRNPSLTAVSDSPTLVSHFSRHNQPVGRKTNPVARELAPARRRSRRIPAHAVDLEKRTGRFWVCFAALREQAPSPQVVFSYEFFRLGNLCGSHLPV
ncbi:hypothetical protein EMIT0215P_260026 [Pseudomonas serboccidentalis]